MEILYHGTTESAAKSIFEDRAFGVGRTFFTTMGQSWMASLFAKRSCQKPGDRPAAVVVYLPEAVSQRMREQGMLRMVPFDPEDTLVEVRGKLQVVVEDHGIEMLNANIEAWYVYGSVPGSPDELLTQPMLRDD